MSWIRKKEKLEFLLEIIRSENSGDSKYLARRLNVSPRTIKNYISILRQLGHDIVFDTINQKYRNI